MKFAPKEVIPPIFRSNTWNVKLTKATIVPVTYPNKIVTNGIIKKCIGTPNGEGIDNDDSTNETTAKIAM